MKINRNSWHYRYMKFVQESVNNGIPFNEPKSLCSYMVLLIFHLTYVPFVSVVFCAGVLFLLPFGAFFGFVWLIAHGLQYLLWRYCGLKVKHWENPPQQNQWLFVQWLKAKKDKVCPLIEYEE